MLPPCSFSLSPCLSLPFPLLSSSGERMLSGSGRRARDLRATGPARSTTQCRRRALRPAARRRPLAQVRRLLVERLGRCRTVSLRLLARHSRRHSLVSGGRGARGPPPSSGAPSWTPTVGSVAPGRAALGPLCQRARAARAKITGAPLVGKSPEAPGTRPPAQPPQRTIAPPPGVHKSQVAGSGASPFPAGWRAFASRVRWALAPEKTGSVSQSPGGLPTRAPLSCLTQGVRVGERKSEGRTPGESALHARATPASRLGEVSAKQDGRTHARTDARTLDQRHHMMDGDGKRKGIHEAKVLAQLLSDRECSQSTWEIR